MYKTYKTKVDLRSREAMIDFLTNHFRYYTMNSWNGLTSYANNVKCYYLGLTQEQTDKFFELISSDYNDFYDCCVDPLIEDFEEDTGYTADFNGRSNGYLVMYDFSWKELDYKSRCTNCCQLNYTTVEESGCKCGRCGKYSRVNLSKPVRQKRVSPKDIDGDADFPEWDIKDLQNRVRLVQRFDELCDDIRSNLVHYLDSHEVVEEDYIVTKTRKVFKEIA